jgi:tRNA(Ile)-lysidine synthase
MPKLRQKILLASSRIDGGNLDREPVFPSRNASRAWVDADKVSESWDWRTRREGDRFSPLGVSSHSRKLKVFLQERKIPRYLRDQVPLLAVGNTVVWVVGHGISDHFKVTPATERILELETLEPTWQIP